MKLRIRGNSIRLRLMQVEVKTLEQTAEVRDAILLPGGEALKYELKISDLFNVVLENRTLSITIPEPDAFRWIQTEEEGLENLLNLPNGDELRLSVEKDFKCLTVRPHEDESDTFPNKSEGTC